VLGEGHLYLVGFMGSGKSVIGRLLAVELGWRFVDVDARVVQKEGRSIEEIFAASGEKSFREAEWEALRTISQGPRAVVATGGGLFMSLQPRALIKRTGISLWLDAPFEKIRERLEGGSGRPLWENEKPVAMRLFYERRRAAYALADLRIDPSRDTPEGIAREARGRLGPLSR